MDLPLDIEMYIREHIGQENPLLKELERETNLSVLNPRMLSGHIQGSILSLLVKMIKPKLVLEIGTYTGYSSICIAWAMEPGGRLITIERDEELACFGQKYFTLAGVTDTIQSVTGDALEVIPSLEGPFDLVFIDGDKREYCAYYDLIIGKVPSGGWILADNTLWGGKVVTFDVETDNQTAGVHRFNEKIRDDQRVEKVIVPLRDGLTIIRKK